MDGLAIPAEDDSADLVCFFSLFTHLWQHESFRYLREARRVLKPGGRVVFSFYDFAVEAHWRHFEYRVEHPDDVINCFLSQAAIGAWAAHAGLRVVAIQNGGTPFIPIEGSVQRDDGTLLGNPAAFSQSIAVLEKPGDGS